MLKIENITQLPYLKDNELYQFKSRQMYILPLYDNTYNYYDYLVYSYSTLVAIIHEQTGIGYVMKVTTAKYSRTTSKQITMLRNDLEYWYNMTFQNATYEELDKLRAKIVSNWESQN